MIPTTIATIARGSIIIAVIKQIIIDFRPVSIGKSPIKPRWSVVTDRPGDEDDRTHFERIAERADRHFHSVAQTHLSEFGGSVDLYPEVAAKE